MYRLAGPMPDELKRLGVLDSAQKKADPGKVGFEWGW